MPHSVKKRASGLPDLINATIGCWFFLSPFFLGHFEEMTSSLNAYVVGSVIAIFAGYARTEYHAFNEIVVSVFGLWLVVAPWALGFSALTTIGTWSAVVTGLVVVALAAWSALVEHAAPLAPAKAH